MPDGIRLTKTTGESHLEPNFEAWKAQYLYKLGGSEDDIRETGSQPDEVTNKQDAADSLELS